MVDFGNNEVKCYKIKDETDVEFLLRMMEEVKIPQDMSWVGFGNFMNEILGNEYTESKYRKQYKRYLAKKNTTNVLEKNSKVKLKETNNSSPVVLSDKELKYQERVKLSNRTRELNQTLKIKAETELFQEMILQSLKKVNRVEIKPRVENKKNNLENKALLVFSDAHYGKVFKLVGLSGEIINEYSPSVFEDRMCNLLYEVADDVKQMNISYLEIVDDGDCIDGVLRTGSSLRKLTVNTVDGIIEYANFITNWLITLFNLIDVEMTYSLTGGNHDQLRLLSSKKDFDDENVAKVIHNMIQKGIEIEKLKFQSKNGYLPTIFVSDYNEGLLRKIGAYNIFCYHGDDKNLKESLYFFENFYGIKIDMVITGHLHSESKETVGIANSGDKEIIRVPSICGTDDFAKKIRKNSRAGAKLFVFKGNKKEWEKTYSLN